MMSETEHLLVGWRKGGDFRGEETYLNDEREMMVITSNFKSTLVKENDIYLEITGDDHFAQALRKSDEIWASDYAPKQ